MTTKINSINLGPNLVLPGAPAVGVSPSYVLNDTTIASTQFVKTVLTNYTQNLLLNAVTVGEIGAGGGTVGSIRLQKGTNGTGFMEFYAVNGVRQGYIGAASSLAGTTDFGTNNYVAAIHAFTGAITASGNISSTSDLRLKINVNTIQDALHKVSMMRGVSYVKDGKSNIGVIAQEVQQIIPEVVSTDDTGYLSVSYGNLVGLLIEAIKGLKLEIDVLKGNK